MNEEKFISQEEYVSQMERGALLNPRIDSTFKALFTQPTPESKAALHSFLEAATERTITKFHLTANDVPIDFVDQRGVNTIKGPAWMRGKTKDRIPLGILSKFTKLEVL